MDIVVLFETKERREKEKDYLEIIYIFGVVYRRVPEKSRGVDSST
jgi:hypothetical protein